MAIEAAGLKSMFRSMKDRVTKEQRHLIELDSVSGDGDLGLSMYDGFTAVDDALGKSADPDLGKLLYLAGKTFNTYASSTTGTLFSSGLIASAKALKGKTRMNTGDLCTMAGAWAEGIMSLGSAKQGEKTLLDALLPAVDALTEAAKQDTDVHLALTLAAEAADRGAQATEMMRAVHGRAAVRGDDSVGMIDPGAVLFAMLFDAMAEAV